jgi:hypothetical protein
MRPFALNVELFWLLQRGWHHHVVFLNAGCEIVSKKRKPDGMCRRTCFSFFLALVLVTLADIVATRTFR